MNDKQTDLETSQDTTMNRNPTGKGGFKDNPQNIGDGRPKNQQSITYWMHQFLDMTQKEFKDWDSKDKPMAAVLAHKAVENSKVELPERKEVADRTEGRAKQTFEHAGEVISTVNVRIIRHAAELELDGSVREELPEPKENNS